MIQESNHDQLNKIAEYSASSQNQINGFNPEIRSGAAVQRQLANGLTSKVRVEGQKLEQNFESKVLTELKQQNQLKSLLDGIAPGVIGMEELVLLLIWTKPLIPP